MSRFKGAKQSKMLTKGELMERYEKRFEYLANSLQGLQNITFKQLQDLAIKNAALAKQLEAVDFRSVTTRDLAIKDGLFTDEDHTEHARNLRIESFAEQSAKDDAARGLIDTDGVVKLGDFVTMEIVTRHPETIEVPSIKDKSEVQLTDAEGKGEAIVTKETQPHPNAGEKIDSLTFLRSKAQIGSGELMAELEKELVGVKKGETKEVKMVMPARYAEFANKEVVFTVDVVDVKAMKPQEEALKVVPEQEITDGEAKEEEK